MVLELKKSNDAQQTKMSEDMEEKNDHVPENCKVASYLGLKFFYQGTYLGKIYTHFIVIKQKKLQGTYLIGFYNNKVPTYLVIFRIMIRRS